MALETLKDVKTIDGFEVARQTWRQPEAPFIEINDRDNAITFRIQNGPIKENGVNGCQIDTLAATFITMLEGLNSQYSCQENEQALLFFRDGLRWLKKRKANREARGVEGTNKE